MKMNLLDNLNTIIKEELKDQKKVFKTPRIKLLEWSIGDTLGDAIRMVFGLLGPIGWVPLGGAVVKNVTEINGGVDILKKEMLNLEDNPTLEGVEKIEEYMNGVVTDILDLVATFIEMIPDITGTSDVATFLAEQLLQILAEKELPVLLDKLHPVIDAVPFAGKTDVAKAMHIVGEAHELLTNIREGMAEVGAVT